MLNHVKSSPNEINNYNISQLYSHIFPLFSISFPTFLTFLRIFLWILAGSTSSIIKEPPAAGETGETAETAETTAAGEAAELPAAEAKEATKMVDITKKE